MVAEILSGLEEEESRVFKKATPIIKTTYIARETYKIGFAMATFLMNASFKEAFGEESNSGKAGMPS